MTSESLPDVSAKVAAAVIGITERHFRRLVRDGVLPRVGKRRFNVPAVVQAMLEYVSAGREGAGDLAEERRLLTIAQRKQIELATALRREQTVELAVVARTFDGAMVIVGGQLDGLAGRMAGPLATMSDPAVIRKVLFDECRRIRSSAADALEAFAARVARSEDLETPAE